jgi:hypothetical protein
MRKLSLFLVPFIFVAACFGQSVLPNISYNAQLNATCSNANTGCTNAVFVTGYGSTGTPGSFGTGAALDIPVANFAAATVTVSGTYAGSTINFEFSDPTSGTNYFQEVCARTDINLLEISEVLPTNQVRAWNCPVWAATRFRVRQSAYTSGSVNVWVTVTQAAIDPSLVVAASIANVAGASDPCQDLSAIKTSVPISAAGVGTTQLVALSGTTAVYVCSYQAAANAGTNPSFQLEYGTGSSCGTGTTALTGAMSTGVTVSTTAPGPIFESSPGNSILKAPAGNALCMVVAGTSAVFNGWLSYVQQ